MATASADLQPDLPLDGVRSSPPSWNATAASRDSQASLDAEAAGMPRGAADDVLRAEGMAPQNDWLEAAGSVRIVGVRPSRAGRHLDARG